MSSSPGVPHTNPLHLLSPLTINTTTLSHDVTSTTPPPPPPLSPPIPTATTTATSFSDASLAVREVLAAMLVVVMVVGVGGNGLLCVLVYRKAAMRSAINLLVAQLAFSDVLLSCGVMPLTLADLFLPVTLTWSRWLCVVEAASLEVLVTVNTCLLLAVSLDRYLIILHRKEKLTVDRSRVIILATWGFSLLCAAPPLLGWGTFSTFSSQPLCLHLATRGGPSELSYILLSSLLTKFLPMSAILYSYARIISVVRKKNTKVHHLAVDVSVTPNSGAAPRGPSWVQGSVDNALREVSNTASSCAANVVHCLHCGHNHHSGKAAVFSSSSSSSSVRFVSQNSTVHLRCADHPPPCCRQLCLSASVIPKCSSESVLLKVTHSGSVDATVSFSPSSVASCGCQQNGSGPAASFQPPPNAVIAQAARARWLKAMTVCTGSQSESSSGERCSNEARNGNGCSDGSRRPFSESTSVSSCGHHPRQSKPERTHVISATCRSEGCPEASVSCSSAVNRHQRPSASSKCCHCTGGTCAMVEGHDSVHRKPEELNRTACCGRCVGEGRKKQCSPPSLSSPSGFSPRANGVRRTAGCRRQVVDMSFKTRAFKTIFILSLLLCLCWAPFFTASIITSLSSSSSSSSTSSSTSSFSSSTSSPCSEASPPSPSFPFSSSPSLSPPISCSSLTSTSSSSSSSSSTLNSSSHFQPDSSSSSSSSSSSPPPPPSSPLHVLRVLLLLGFLKSALNPMVYVLRIRKFREALWVGVVPCGCCSPRGANGCGHCPRWGDVLGKRRVNPRTLYQC